MMLLVGWVSAEIYKHERASLKYNCVRKVWSNNNKWAGYFFNVPDEITKIVKISVMRRTQCYSIAGLMKNWFRLGWNIAPSTKVLPLPMRSASPNLRASRRTVLCSTVMEIVEAGLSPDLRDRSNGSAHEVMNLGEERNRPCEVWTTLYSMRVFVQSSGSLYTIEGSPLGKLNESDIQGASAIHIPSPFPMPPITCRL